jgi:outer membrane protein
MRTIVIRAACLIAAVAAASGTQVFVSAQVLFPAGSGIQQQAARSAQAAAAQQPAAAAPQVRRLTADEAVRLAVENNLGIQIARVDPRIEDLNVLSARANWSPSFTSTLQNNRIQRPSTNIFTGSTSDKLTNDQLLSNFGLQQNVPWGGGAYDVTWNTQRSASNISGNTWNPSLNSSLAFNYAQPLLRNFSIDSIRQNLQVSLKNREIADVGLRQTLASTTRTVRNAYWNLAYAVASLAVQQQSLDLAQESLRNTRARVEIGTTPPIDVVEAESEVAAREESVIVAQASIATAEDTLRALVYDPAMPEFWTMRIEPTELPPFQPTTVDVDAAVRNALERRTDLQQTVKSMEATDVNIRFFQNQTLPDITANINSGLQAVGGRSVPLTNPIPGAPPTPGGAAIEKSYASVLHDILAQDFPSWTAQLNITYPIGTSPAEANLARARLQHTQSQTRLKNQQLQVGTQVRLQARNVSTNQQRVQSTRASRQLAERRLDAEQRKFQAGTSTSFLVFQAQRDLSLARNNELRAILDYNQSVVDFETVQEIPLGGGGVATVATGPTQ